MKFFFANQTILKFHSYHCLINKARKEYNRIASIESNKFQTCFRPSVSTQFLAFILTQPNPPKKNTWGHLVITNFFNKTHSKTTPKEAINTLPHFTILIHKQYRYPCLVSLSKTRSQEPTY